MGRFFVRAHFYYNYGLCFIWIGVLCMHIFYRVVFLIESGVYMDRYLIWTGVLYVQVFYTDRCFIWTGVL